MFRRQREEIVEKILEANIPQGFTWNKDKSGWDIKLNEREIVHLFFNLTNIGIIVHGPTHTWLNKINDELRKKFTDQPTIEPDSVYESEYMVADDWEALCVLFVSLDLRLEKKGNGYEINEDRHGILGDLQDLADNTPLGFLSDDLKEIYVLNPESAVWQTVVAEIERRFKTVPALVVFPSG